MSKYFPSRLSTLVPSNQNTGLFQCNTASISINPELIKFARVSVWFLGLGFLFSYVFNFRVVESCRKNYYEKAKKGVFILFLHLQPHYRRCFSRDCKGWRNFVIKCNLMAFLRSEFSLR